MEKDSNVSGSDICTQSRKKVNNERGPSGGDYLVSESVDLLNNTLPSSIHYMINLSVLLHLPYTT